MAKQRNTPDDEPESREKPKRRPSRLMWLGSRLVVVAILLAVLVYFAPLLITSTGVWRTAISTAAPELASSLKIDSLELGWFAPVQVKGIAVTDPSGQPLAQVPSVRSQKTLLAVALGGLGVGPRDVGVFEVEQPKLRIVLRADGSNVEDLLAKLPKSEGKSQPMGLGLRIVNGVVELDDQVAQRQWSLENLAADVTIGANQAMGGKVATLVRSLSGPNAAGNVAAEFEVGAAPADAPLGPGKAAVALQDFPLEIAEGGLRRFVGDIRPQGSLSLKAAAAWKDLANAEATIEHVASAGIAVAAPAWLATDRPAMAIASGKADVKLAAKQISLRELALDTSLVQLSGQGAAGQGGLSAASAEVRANVNLAEVARQLPATLRMKQDTQLQSGAVEITLATSSAADGRQLKASLRTRDLRGLAGGRELRFDQPLEVDLAVRQTQQGPIIDNLVGKASFLRLEGSGSLDDGGIKAEADLNKLVAELGRLIEWGDTRLAGSVVSDVRWKQEAGSGWNANAELRVQNFEAAALGIAPWREPQLRLVANVRGDLTGGKIEQIRAGQATLEAGADRLEVQLTEPVRSPSLATALPAKFSLRGDLASWTPRLQPFVPLGGWRMGGAISVDGSARVSQKEAEFAQTSLELTQLAVDGPGVMVREPQIVVKTSGAWSQPNMTLTLGSTTLASSAVAFRADGVRVVAGREPSLVGTIDFRGDLGRLSSWMTSPEPRQSQFLGGLVGRVEIGYRGQALAANWNCDADNLKYLVAPPPNRNRTALASTSAASSTPWQPLWEEAKIQFVGEGAFDPVSGALKIQRTSLASSTLSLTAAGTLTKLGAQPEVDLTGEVSYDLGLITQEIQNRSRAQAAAGSAQLPYGLDTLQLTGKQKRQFVLKGPLFAATREVAATGEVAPTGGAAPPTASVKISEALVGEASLGWESAQYVGLMAGAADFRARLASGIVNIGPLDIPLAEGRLTTAPRVLLNDPGLTVAVDRGPLLQNVRISPEMCSLWLKFVAPLVADATRAEGKFSLSLEGANVPLASPLASNVAGTLSIHNAQIGPGPLAQQYLGMAMQLKGMLKNGLGGLGGTGGAAGDSASASESQSSGWVVLPEQDVLFEVHDATVLNRGLKMAVGDVVITTEGSVDVQTQRISLVASVPMNDNWFKDQKSMFAALKGQTLKIPIDGTLTQPRLDTRALQNLGKQLAGAAVQGVLNKQLERGQGALNKELEKGQNLLQNEIGQGLNRFFGPRTPQPTTPAPAPR